MTYPASPAAGGHQGHTRPRSDRPQSQSGLINNALAADQLGPAKILSFTLTAQTSLTVVAGVVTTGIALTGQIGISLGFVVVAIVLSMFAAGYVEMARLVGNAGAFYSFVAHGLSRRLAVGAAYLALLAYNALQVGLYGLFGVAAGPVAEQFLHIDWPWWAFALIAWVVTAFLGQLKVDLNGTVLTVLLIAEVAVILWYSAAFVTGPTPEGLSLATFEPANLFTSGFSSIVVLCTLGFIGFESSVVYSEESRNRSATVRIATYVSIAVAAVLYAFASWAVSVGIGPSQLVEAARTQQSELIFTMAANQLGQFAATIGHLLLLTSVWAALLSFHHTCSRYAYSLGREHVLPAALGRTSVRTQAPYVASAVQSAFGLAVILLYAITGLDPLVQLFYFAGTAGGIGVLVLLLMTAAAVFWYFTGHPNHGVGAFSAYIWPMLAFAALLIGVILALTSITNLLGVPGDHPLTWLIPVIIVASLGLGFARGSYLRARRPDVYDVIGQGVDISTTRIGATTGRGSS